MGYITISDIKVSNRYRKLIEQELMSFVYDLFNHGCLIKYHEYRDNMKKISLKYPNITILVSMSEDHANNWHEKWQNGSFTEISSFDKFLMENIDPQLLKTIEEKYDTFFNDPELDDDGNIKIENENIQTDHERLKTEKLDENVAKRIHDLDIIDAKCEVVERCHVTTTSKPKLPIKQVRK